MGTHPGSGKRGRVRRPSQPRPAAVGAAVLHRGSPSPHRDQRSSPAPPSEPEERSWLPEALRELDEVAGGIDVDGPHPSGQAVAEARSLLRDLAGWVDDAPAVDDDADGGVGIEFYGPKGRRLLLIVASDGSAVYQELIAGRVVTEEFADWRQLLEAFGREAFQRVGLAVCGEVEAYA